MNFYAILIGVIAGICLAYAILYLFVGLRRQVDKRLNLTFSLFAFAYAGTLLMGIWFRSQTTAEAFIAISRWDSIFIGLAFIGLNWYVAAYTKVGSKNFLWGGTVAIIFITVGVMLTSTLTYSEMPQLTTIPLPWDEEVATLTGEENIWGVGLLLVQLITIGFIIFAGIRQWLRGEKQQATLLLAGMFWFIFALSYEILAEAGLFVYIPLAETGFLGIAIALSLQMANDIIKTEEDLAAHRQNLEAMVIARTSELEAVHTELIEQAQATAVAEERSRLARDLHDAVTQTIYSASLIAEVLPQVWARNPDEGTRNLTKLRQLVRGALAEMRSLLFELRPQALEVAELNMLLPQLADVFTGRTRIPVQLQIEGVCDLPVKVKIAIYRISQEAFNNISKHADATIVRLSLRMQAEQINLVIQDNGRGFVVDDVSAAHMGMAIMQERAANINAYFLMDSEPEHGTQISLVWPALTEGSEEVVTYA